MRSDYVIYLPSLQNALVERQKISKRSLKDSFILDRGCLANKKEAKEEEEAEEVDININEGFLEDNAGNAVDLPVVEKRGNIQNAQADVG